MMKSTAGPKFDDIAFTSFVIMLFLCFLMSIAAFMEFTIPSTEYLAREYFDRVRQGKLETVKPLAGNNQDCQQGLFDLAKKDVIYIGDAELRNLTIWTGPSDGNSDSLEVAKINFEYKRTHQATWKKGMIYLGTDHKMLGFRAICTSVHPWSDYP